MSNHYPVKIIYCKTGCTGHNSYIFTTCKNIDNTSSIYPYSKYYCQPQCSGQHNYPQERCGRQCPTCMNLYPEISLFM